MEIQSKTIFILLTVLLLVSSLSAQKTPKVRSKIISSRELPSRFDETHTFVYTSPTVNAESLLTAMNKAGIRIRKAWLPLDNVCADPVGPRLTVELASLNNRVANFGFTQGVGRLACATTLKLITISF